MELKSIKMLRKRYETIRRLETKVSVFPYILSSDTDDGWT